MENRINSMDIIPRAMSGKECEEYILDYANNYLYKDCGSGECEFISDLELEKGCNGFEYSEIIKLGNDIIAVPNYSKSFLIYNVAKKTIRHIYVDKKLYENNVGKPGLHKIIPYGNKIFCIKYICNAIVCIDKKTLEVTYTDIFDDIKQDWNLFKVVGDCYSYDGLLYIPLMDTNIFVVFDMEKCTHEIKQLYAKRWGIETSFRELKYALGLTRFHAKKPEYIVQEIWSRMTLYNFCEIIATNVVVKQKVGCKYIYQLNYTRAMRICCHFLSIKEEKAPPDVEYLIGHELLPVRSGRTDPRKVKPQSAISFLYRAA